MVWKLCFTPKDFFSISQVPQLLDKNQMSMFFFMFLSAVLFGLFQTPH